MTGRHHAAPRLAATAIPDDLQGRRHAIRQFMSLAYGSVGETGAENWGIWELHIGQVVDELREAYRAAGWCAPRGFWDSFWFRVDLPRPSADGTAHMRLIEALTVDYGEAFEEHILDRINTEGNVLLAIRGFTGSAKSSCAGSIADWLQPIPPEGLLDHYCVDVNRLPAAIKGRPRGWWQILDELLRTAGDGSTTLAKMLHNVEDNIRKSGVCLIVTTPDGHDHATMQFELEAIFSNPKEKKTLFLVWIKGQPHGVIAIPWMRKELYEKYEPWKDGNVARSLAGYFNDNTETARLAVQLFENPKLVRHLSGIANKPKRADIHNAIRWYHPGMLSTAQTDAVTDFTYGALYAFERMAPYFEDDFGVKPNQGMAKIAEKCYKE